MSQRENAGFNWPGFPVAADIPFGAGPESGEPADHTCRPNSPFTGTVPSLVESL